MATATANYASPSVRTGWPQHAMTFFIPWHGNWQHAPEPLGRDSCNRAEGHWRKAEGADGLGGWTSARVRETQKRGPAEAYQIARRIMDKRDQGNEVRSAVEGPGSVSCTQLSQHHHLRLQQPQPPNVECRPMGVGSWTEARKEIRPSGTAVVHRGKAVQAQAGASDRRVWV